MNDEYDVIVPTEELNDQVDLSGYTSWNDNREPVGLPTANQVAGSYANSMNDRGRGGQIGSSNEWAAVGSGFLNAVGQTGVNIWAARNGVYAGQVPNATQNNATPRQAQQTAQAKNSGVMMLALVVGAAYVLAK